MHTHPEKNARLTGRAGTHYFWEFLMLFLAVGGRGVASVRYYNNGFQPVARKTKK